MTSFGNAIHSVPGAGVGELQVSIVQQAGSILLPALQDLLLRGSRAS